MLVRALGQLRGADLDQQVDQRAVALIAEPEQPLVDRAAVVTRPAVDAPARTDRVLEPVRRQRDTGGVGQREVLAPARVGDEEPVRDDPAALHRLHATADRAERGAARRRRRPSSSHA